MSQDLSVDDQKYFLVGPWGEEFRPFLGKRVINLRVAKNASGSLATAILGNGSNEFLFELEGVPDRTFTTHYGWAFWKDTAQSRIDWETVLRTDREIEDLKAKTSRLRAEHRLSK